MVSQWQGAQEFSDMERATETLIKNFHQYSVEGEKETLTLMSYGTCSPSSCPTSCQATMG